MELRELYGCLNRGIWKEHGADTPDHAALFMWDRLDFHGTFVAAMASTGVELADLHGIPSHRRAKKFKCAPFDTLLKMEVHDP